MDRKLIYEEWLNTPIKSQDGRNTYLCTTDYIGKTFALINDFNFECYAKYQKYYIETHKDWSGSIQNIRRSITEFLLSNELSNNNVDGVTIETLDNYYNNKIVNGKIDEASTTFTNKVRFLKGFFKFLSDHGIVNDFDFDKYLVLSEFCKKAEKEVMKSLTPEQISKFRYKFVNDPIYKDKPEYLYVFDMKYYTDFEDIQIKNLLFTDVNILTNTITIDGVEEQVPVDVINNIKKLEKIGALGNLLNINEYFKKMKPVFEEIGFGNIKPKDINKETRKTLSFVCPQCKKTYEAITENWCARQYSDDGNLWIVCKRCGNA